MSSEDRAETENKLADLQEDTEQRMHSVADALPDPEQVHQRANRLSDRAAEHRERAQEPEQDDIS